MFSHFEVRYVPFKVKTTKTVISGQKYFELGNFHNLSLSFRTVHFTRLVDVLINGQSIRAAI